MRKYIAILLIPFTSSSFAQTNLDTLEIDSILIETSSFKKTTQPVDYRVIQTIQAIDKNINSIVRAKTTWTPQKFTVIESDIINIRQLVDRKETIQIILADTTQTINYQSYWNESGQDTIKFLSSMLTQFEFDLHYPHYQYPKALTKIDPLEIQSQLHCHNILFYSKLLEMRIDSLNKTIPRKLRQKYYKYLTSNIDYFDTNKKKVKSKAIRILTITFGADNIIYSGIDIYGSHYLLAFDTGNSWHLDSVKELWTY